MYIPNPKHIKDDFYAVAETGWRPVNKKGEVLSTKTYRPISGTLEYSSSASDRNPYIVVGVDKKYNDLPSKIGVHRVVALTFLSCNGDPKELDVNHIDDNPSNNDLSNLEWVSRKYNNEHAVVSGLNSQNKNVSVKNLISSKYIEFPSIQTAAKYIGCSGGSVQLYLKSSRTKPFWGMWSISYTGEEIKEYDTSKISIFGKNGKDSEIILAIPLFGGKPIVYPSLIKLEYALNRDIKLDEPSTDGYVYCLLKDIGKYCENISDIINDCIIRYDLAIPKGNRTGSKPIPIKVIDENTGNTTIYNSVKVAASVLGMSYSALKKNIWRTKGKFRGYIFEYIKDTSLPMQ